MKRVNFDFSRRVQEAWSLLHSRISDYALGCFGESEDRGSAVGECGTSEITRG